MKEIALDHMDIRMLEEGEHRFDFQLDNAFFQAIQPSELLGGAVAAKVLLTVKGDDFAIHMGINGTVQVTCDRCLEPMDIPVEINEDVDPDDDSKILDLTWLAYECIVTSLPLAHSHQSGGCNPQMAALLQDHLCTEPENPEQ